MTQNDKELLLRDLCGRLPYGVKIYVNDRIEILQNIDILDNVIGYGSFLSCNIDEVKPCLFPMESLPEEKVYEFYCRFVDSDIPFDDFVADYWPNSLHKVLTAIDDVESIMDWYNENHVDCRGMIYRDLAIDATGSIDIKRLFNKI